MESDKQTVNIGLEIDAQYFNRALQEEAIASYQAGYAAHKAERRAAHIKALKQIGLGMLGGFVVTLIFWLVSR